jgi:hypothetical protein
VIRLQSPVSSRNAHAGDIFQGVLDQPIMLQNRTVVPSGTAVLARVLAAKASGAEDPGYLRITISAILLDDKTLEVHTSSLFAKGSRSGPTQSANGNQPRISLTNLAAASVPTDLSHAQGDVKFSTDRRLTFRLVKPLALPS